MEVRIMSDIHVALTVTKLITPLFLKPPFGFLNLWLYTNNFVSFVILCFFVFNLVIIYCHTRLHLGFLAELRI